MTSTTSRSSSSTGPSRSCPNDRRCVRRIRPEPRGPPPDHRALRERVSRRVRLRAESPRPRKPVGPPRHDRVRGLGCRRGGPAVPCSRHIPGRALLLGRVTWVAIAFVPATLYQLALTYPAKARLIRRSWGLATI